MTHTPGTPIQSEWGPWIEHDGQGCPVSVGQYVHAVLIYSRDGVRGKAGQEIEEIGRVTSEAVLNPNWDSRNFGTFRNGFWWGRVLRYRIRRHLVSEWLESIQTQEPVDA